MRRAAVPRLVVLLGLVAALTVTRSAMAALAGTAAGTAILLPEDTSGEQAPVVDGRAGSCTVLGLLRNAESSATVRVDLEPGPLPLELSIPDQLPESAYGVDQLPALTLIGPSGTTASFEADRREPYVDPVSGAALVRVVAAAPTAEEGLSVLAVTGPAPVRFAIGIGEGPSACQVGSDTADLADPVGEWLAAPPPSGPAQGSEGESDLDLERLSRPRTEDSDPGRAAGLPLAVAATAIMVVIVVVVVRSRGSRPHDQLADGSDGQ